MKYKVEYEKQYVYGIYKEYRYFCAECFLRSFPDDPRNAKIRPTGISNRHLHTVCYFGITNNLWIFCNQINLTLIIV